MTTFSTFVTNVANSVFPEGRAKNLVTKHKQIITDGMIELQRRIRCLQQGHCEMRSQGETYFVCGACMSDAVAGAITAVYTLDSAGGCDRVTALYCSYKQMLGLMRYHRSCATDDGADGMTPPGADNCERDTYLADETVDKGHRASYGELYWTIDPQNSKLIVYPCIESTELLVIKWRGLKMSWSDSDDVSVATARGMAFTDRQVQKAVETYLESEAARTLDKDSTAYKLSIGVFNTDAANLILECRRRTQVAHDMEAVDTSAGLEAVTPYPRTSPAAEDDDETTVAYPGNFDLHIYRNVTFTQILIEIQDDNGDPLDLTDYVAYAEARETVDDEVAIDLSPTIPDPSTGEVAIGPFTAEETAAFDAGTYQWDLMIKDGDGNIIGPVLTGRVYCVTPVTQVT